VKAAATLLAGVALLAASHVAAPAQTAPLSDSLKKIALDGVVVFGFRESSIPFSYYDDAQKPIGFSMDLTNLIIEKIKQRLALPNLVVRGVPITSQNRLSLLMNGAIDFECTSTTHNQARARQIAFSDSFFVIGTRLLTRADSGIKDFSDLMGKNVVVGAGTTSELLLRRMNAEKKMGMNVISARDHSESFLMLSTGRAQAMMMDDALLAGERAKAANPADFVITGVPLTREAYGCMIRRDDAQLKALIDEVIVDEQKSGVAAASYAKWFMSPIPPKGVNLDLPMSEDMKALFSKPNDNIPD
jgi:glutamate/aspartate transport system substrate-binding protein